MSKILGPTLHLLPVAGEPGYVWAYAELKLCGTKGSYTDNTSSWTLYYRDGSRINPSGTTYGDFPKP